MELESKEFRNAIIGFCNQSKLPMELKQYILKEIYELHKEQAEKLAYEQYQEREKSKQETDEVVEKGE